MRPTLPERIFLTGFMATGKSRMAGLLAASLGWKVLDTDAMVERAAGMRIAEIFSRCGEEAFRRLEREAVEEACGAERAVIALGGGALMGPGVLERVRAAGVLVALYADADTILQRTRRRQTRPLLAGLGPRERLEKIEKMLKEREPVYARAHIRLPSSDAVPRHRMAAGILQRIKLHGLQPVRVELGNRSYPIYAGAGVAELAAALGESLGIEGRYVIATDDNLRQKRPELLRRLSLSLGRCRVFTFHAGEGEKNLRSLNRLYTFLLKHAYARDTTLVAVGGGVVGDLTGFAAATYLRGIGYIQMPTTLLAMVDSAVGGKTGVNHSLGKNMIGAIHQPLAVLADLEALATLPEQEYRAGLAEVVKYGAIWDADFFAYLEDNAEALAAREGRVVGETVLRSCCIKAEIVSADERETGVRSLLNYGHTFAHALETTSGYSGLVHGFAVALGMRVAARLSVLMGWLDGRQEMRQAELLRRLGLFESRPVDVPAAWEAMGRDKKNTSGARNYILLRRLGRAEKTADADPGLVERAWEAVDAKAGKHRDATTAPRDQGDPKA